MRKMGGGQNELHYVLSFMLETIEVSNAIILRKVVPNSPDLEKMRWCKINLSQGIHQVVKYPDDVARFH